MSGQQIPPEPPAGAVDLQQTLARGAAIRDRGLDGQDDFDAAIEVCRASIPLLPDPAPAQALLGRLLLAANRPVEAVEAFRVALTRMPENLQLWAGMGQALYGAGDNETALQACEHVLTANPNDTDALYVCGNAQLALHRPRAAAGIFERGVALEPDRARMHQGLGDAYAELDLTEAALEHLSRAVDLSPMSSAAHANLGSMLWRRGDLEKAEQHCLLALAIEPDMVAAHQNLSGVYGDKGDPVRSRHHRDTAYGLRNLFIENAPRPRATVLVLTTADSGNIPHRYLLPVDNYSRIDWFIEYAREGQAAQLPAYDVVFNIIGDPDYADETETPVAAFMAVCERPVLNHPSRVGPTRRDRLPGLLADIPGLALPRAARFGPSDIVAGGIEAAVGGAGLTAPLLVRPIGSHGGRGLTLVQSLAELDACGIDAGAGLYATEFCDFRSADGLYRKYRVIFVDRAPYPYHLAVANDWLVHYDTAEMRGDAARQAEEMRFLADPRAALGEAVMDAVTAIGQRLDLDYAGVDFSILPDGRVLVFEANATMLVHPDDGGEFVHKNPFVERITGAFQALIARRSRI